MIDSIHEQIERFETPVIFALGGGGVLESVIVAANLKTITWQHLVSTASPSPKKTGTGRRGSLAAHSWVWLWMTK